MSGIDGIGGSRTSPWENYYEKPLPKEAHKAAVAVANAPWLDRVDHAPAYSPEMFSNPAMRGPSVMLASPPPPATPKPTALAAAPNAFQGIELAITASTPRYERLGRTEGGTGRTRFIGAGEGDLAATRGGSTTIRPSSWCSTRPILVRASSTATSGRGTSSPISNKMHSRRAV